MSRQRTTVNRTLRSFESRVGHRGEKCHIMRLKKDDADIGPWNKEFWYWFPCVDQSGVIVIWDVVARR
jgi:hypothetical protein